MDKEEERETAISGAVAIGVLRSTPPSAPAPSSGIGDVGQQRRQRVALLSDRVHVVAVRGAAPPRDKEQHPASPKCQSERAAETAVNLPPLDFPRAREACRRPTAAAPAAPAAISFLFLFPFCLLFFALRPW